MNSNDLVKNILQRDVDEQDRILKSTEVLKPIPVDIDLGNLLAWDPNIIDQSAYKYEMNLSLFYSIEIVLGVLEKIGMNTSKLPCVTTCN